MEVVIEDYDVIQEVLQGNPNAYAVLVRKYEERVRRYCFMTLGNASYADDAAQEVFVKAYQSLAKFRGDASFSTWVYRIAVNHCTDMQRKAARQRTQSWDELLEKEGEKMEELFSASPQTKTKIEHADLLAQLLSHLDEKSREVLILREMNGMSYDEIAETLGISLDAVKSRLKRTRQELEIKLKHFLKVGGV